MAKSAYEIIRRPVITEKGLGAKETEHTLVFEVSVKASKTQIKEAVQSIFKVKVDQQAALGRIIHKAVRIPCLGQRSDHLCIAPGDIVH